MVHRDSKKALYTIKPVFAAEQAALARAVLGDHPRRTVSEAPAVLMQKVLESGGT